MEETVIEINGIECEGKHGVFPFEKNELQQFLLHVKLGVNFLPQEGDDIDKTIDYDFIIAKVKNIVNECSFDLIESLGHKIIAELFSLDNIVMAEVQVCKPNAARNLLVDSIGVTVKKKL